MDMKSNKMSLKKSGVNNSKREVKIKFAIFVFAVVLVFGAFNSLLTLQSSVHIVDGLGVGSGTAIYISAAIFGITFTPVVIQLLGLKWTVACAYIFFLLYTCANCYPNTYLFATLGVFVGMAEVSCWPAFMVYCVHYGRRYAKLTGKPRDYHNSQFLGNLFSMLYVAMMLSNILTYCILFVGRSPKNSQTNNTDSTDSVKLHDFSVCGVNDCQDPNATRENVAQYVPPQTTLYILFGSFGVIILAATAVHILFTDNPDPSLESKPIVVKREDASKCYVNTVESDEDQTVSHNVKAVENFDQTNPNGLVVELPGHYAQDKEMNEDRNVEPKRKKNYIRLALSSLKETLQQMVRPKQLLIMPFSFYTGFMQVFIYGEMPRAFGSCILGVDQVGLCILAFSGANACSSILVGKISSRTGNHVPLGVAMVIDIGTALFCLLWVPTNSTKWLVYCLFGVAGITSGIRVTMTTDVHARFFPEDHEKAMMVWSFCHFTGYALQFGWSTAVCVRYKIYFQVALLLFGMATYVAAEFLHRKESTEKKR